MTDYITLFDMRALTDEIGRLGFDYERDGATVRIPGYGIVRYDGQLTVENLDGEIEPITGDQLIEELRSI